MLTGQPPFRAARASAKACTVLMSRSDFLPCSILAISVILKPDWKASSCCVIPAFSRSVLSRKGRSARRPAQPTQFGGNTAAAFLHFSKVAAAVR
jgi:hypothetical protein